MRKKPLWIILAAALSGCAAREQPVIAGRSKQVTQAQLENAWQVRMSQEWAASPNNHGFPLYLDAQEQAKILRETFVRLAANSGSPLTIDPAFGPLWGDCQAAQVATSNKDRSKRFLMGALAQGSAPLANRNHFERTCAVLSTLDAYYQLNRLDRKLAAPYAEKAHAFAAETTEDPSEYLALFDLFSARGDKLRACASLEDAILSDMRRSTTQHLQACKIAFAKGKRDQVLGPAQAGYIQSLFDRFAGSLE